MLNKEEIQQYEKKKVVVDIAANEKSERYYVILARLLQSGIQCIDARSRSLTFSYDVLTLVSEMSPRQKEKFDLIRHGKAGIQHELNSW